MPRDWRHVTMTRFRNAEGDAFTMLAKPTPPQDRVFGLLEIDPASDVAIYMAGRIRRIRP